MKYYAKNLGLPFTSDAEIDENTYNTILENYSFINLYNSIEERYDLVINNYLAFERQKIDVSLDFMMFNKNYVTLFYESKRAIIRALNNLLSSCRLFLDQNDKGFIHSNKDIYDELKTYKNSIYSREKSYRLIEYLRNVLQHKMMPIEISFHRKFEETKAVDHIEVCIKNEDIKEDADCNKKIGDIIAETKGNQINLKEHINRYMECMNDIMLFIRKKLEMKYSSSRAYLEYRIDMYNKIKIPEENEIQKIIYLVARDDSGESLKEQQISDSFIRNISYLQNLNLLNIRYSKIEIHN